MTQLQVRDKATREPLGEVTIAAREEVARAPSIAALEAFASWSRVPVVERARLLFRYTDALERRREDIALSVSRENGKTLTDASAEVRRGIEAVEFACGMPSLMMGDALPTSRAASIRFRRASRSAFARESRRSTFRR